jgi:hypothetical protein
MLMRNTLYKGLAECADSESTGTTRNGFVDRDEWEELPFVLQSGDVSDLIWAARQRGLSAPALARSILCEFLQHIRGAICGGCLPRSQP